MISKKIVRVIIITAIAFLVITGVLVAAMFLHPGANSAVIEPEIMLPIFIIGGVLVLLVTLALTAVVFAGVDLTDRTQALGLPEGSVRSVIALSLILLFAIVTIFLYSSLSSNGKIVASPPLSQEARDSFKKGLPNAQYLFDQPSGTGADQKYVVYYRDIANPASEDFAKQLLAILATLVTAVSSFYFGAKTATSGGQDPTHPTPVIRGVNPAKVVRGTAPKLELTGDGLDLIKEVKIAFGGRQILATSVLSNASSITCQLAVDADAPVGAWDVIATDGKGAQAKLGGGLTVA
ncbi:MAG TPA: hypothetical protein VKX28_07675 [Xanthobacteraceae bacterium]|nr:hypothetical protein [Xanthobacteraceae bacterium]